MAAVFVAMGLSSWISDQHRLADWRIVEPQLHWMPATSSQLPRLPIEGEALHRVHWLPFGNQPAVQIFHHFNTPTGKVDEMAILAPAIDGQVQAYVNFAPIRERSLAAQPGFSRPRAQTRLWAIPRDYLHTGKNRIDLIVDGTATRALAAPIYLGPNAVLAPVANWGAGASGAARQLVLTLAMLACIANLSAFVFCGRIRPLAIAAAFSATCAWLLIGEAGEQLGPAWRMADPLFLAGMAICASLALRHDSYPLQRAQKIDRGLLFITVLLGAATALAGATGAASSAFWAGTVSVLSGMTCLVRSMVIALPEVNVMPVRRQILWGSVAGLALMSAALAFAGATGIFMPGPPYGPDIGLAAALAMLALVATVCGCISTVRAIRTRLDQARTIRLQKAALEASALALEDKTRHSALLEERQRMARDVHDGIGGQLASLIAQVRMRRISMDHVETALVGGLAELRFLVNSLDVVGESLTDALASFLERAQQQIASAGMTLEWSQAEDLTAEIREPKWILDLYRLMQEAITNAIRHSGGDRISVSVSKRDSCILVVRIEDNGTGFGPEEIKRGRGLGNMEHRASDLGGTLSITRSESGGLVVLVEAPLP